MGKIKKVIKHIVKTLTPSRSFNVRSVHNYRKLAELLDTGDKTPRVLVIGGRILGKGIKELVENPAIAVLETDLRVGPRTQVCCDAHALPFHDGTFDAVIVQAVLEHVFDPVQCVREIIRVLTENGYVYAETPFLYPLHDAPYDFQRFTYIGHRRLFRHFAEIDSGCVAGPGTALYCAYVSFLAAFSDRPYISAIFMRLALLTGFWIKYFDYFLINKKGALGSAAVYYFLGRKSDTPLSDAELMTRSSWF